MTDAKAKRSTLVINYRKYKNGSEQETYFTGNPSREIKIAMLEAIVNDLLPRETFINSIIRLLK